MEYLNNDEILKLENGIVQAFYGGNLHILRERHPDIINVNLMILEPEHNKDFVVACTEGMSAHTMKNGNKCEILFKINRDAFSSYDLESMDTLNEVLDDRYDVLLSDMVFISKLPARKNVVFNDYDIIDFEEYSYAFNPIFKIDDTQIYYATLLMGPSISTYRALKSEYELDLFLYQKMTPIIMR